MQVSEEKLSLAKEILKEYDDMEASRREKQYETILKMFRNNLKTGNGTSLFYSNVIHDDVRKRLEKDGFKVETKTISSTGSVAYEISKKEGYPSGNEI